jgi:hypothetical protein
MKDSAVIDWVLGTIMQIHQKNARDLGTMLHVLR